MADTKEKQGDSKTPPIPETLLKKKKLSRKTSTKKRT